MRYWFRPSNWGFWQPFVLVIGISIVLLIAAWAEGQIDPEKLRAAQRKYQDSGIDSIQ